MSNFLNKKEKIQTATTKEADLSTSWQMTNLLERVKIASKSYEEKLENYYQESHQVHQAEQKLLKLKRHLINLMQKNNIDHLNVRDDLSAQLIEYSSNVVIDDDNAIPLKYVTIQRVINSAKLKKALNAGETIPGVRLGIVSLDLQLAPKMLRAS